MIDDERREMQEDDDRQWAHEKLMEDYAELAEYQQSEDDYRQSLEKKGKKA